MKTRIFTIGMLLMAGTIFFSNSAFAERKCTKFASSLENATDPSLQIESWMTSDLIWYPGAFSEMVTAREESAELEVWMVNTLFWDRFEDAGDNVITIEEWMTNTMIWEKAAVVAEPGLELEDWMLDNNIWNS